MYIHTITKQEYPICRGQVPRHPQRENTWIIDHQLPPPQKKNSIFSVFFFIDTLRWKLLIFNSPPPTPWTSYSTPQRPVQVVEKFWCTHPMKGLSDVIFFHGMTQQICRPRSTNPWKARDECTHLETYVNITHWRTMLNTFLNTLSLLTGIIVNTASNCTFKYKALYKWHTQNTLNVNLWIPLHVCWIQYT